jgi:membrane dipeptidase
MVPASPPRAETPEERAARLHAQAIIVDGHNDIPSIMQKARTDLAHPGAGTHTDLARMKASGIGAEFFSIYVDAALVDHPTALGGGPLRRALDLVDLTYRQVEKYPADLVLATSVDEIRMAKKDGKIAVLMGVEGGHAIESSLGALRMLHRLGCRYMTLTHTNTNEWADSSGTGGATPARHHGLTPFGQEVVREMQRIGMLVDVSHVSDETFWATLKVARAPIIASHSSARALAEHRRNLSDDMLRGVAQNGGIVMVNFWPQFLSHEYAQARPGPRITLSRIVDHIDHIVKVAGIDHVGLGSDFDGVPALPEDLGGIEGLPKITLELVRRGYSDQDILKILGENFLRVMSQAEAYARAAAPAHP